MTQSKFAHGFQLNFLSNDAQSMANHTVIPRLRTLVSNETYQLHPIHISVNFYNVSDNVFNVGSHSNNKHRLTGNYFQSTRVKNVSLHFLYKLSFATFENCRSSVSNSHISSLDFKHSLH